MLTRRVEWSIKLYFLLSEMTCLSLSLDPKWLSQVGDVELLSNICLSIYAVSNLEERIEEYKPLKYMK